MQEPQDSGFEPRGQQAGASLRTLRLFLSLTRQPEATVGKGVLEAVPDRT